MKTYAITTPTGTYTGLAYEYMNAGNRGSGDWLMLDRSAGWWLIPSYRLLAIREVSA
jgi:hypothetical protein